MNEPEVSHDAAAEAQPPVLALALLTKCMRIAKLLRAVDFTVDQVRYIATDEEWAALAEWHYGKHVDQFNVDGITVIPQASVVVPAPSNGQG